MKVEKRARGRRPRPLSPGSRFLHGIAERHPGVFGPIQDDGAGDAMRVASAEKAGGRVDVSVGTFFSEATVGIGPMSHGHHDLGAPSAYALVVELLAGRVGCFDVYRGDGSLVSSRMVDLEASTEVLVAQMKPGCHASLSFFGGRGDADFLSG